MDERLKKALSTDRTIDITTIGRKSGRARRIEIWFHNLGGSIYITGTPGKRSWYANMLSNSHFTFHLKESIVADLTALAIPVLDADQRRRILAEVTRKLRRREKTGEWVASNDEEFEQWVEGSPLVEVKFISDTQSS